MKDLTILITSLLYSKQWVKKPLPTMVVVVRCFHNYVFFKSISSDFNVRPRLKATVFKVITIKSFFHLLHL